MIIITGSFRSRPETRDELLQVCIAHSERSRAEPGCISHDFSVSCEDSNQIFAFERWTDAAAVKVHFGVPDSGIFVKQLNELSDGPATITIYDTEEMPMSALLRGG